jgi:predicted Ser/Thr protein kinase
MAETDIMEAEAGNTRAKLEGVIEKAGRLTNCGIKVWSDKG